MYRLLFFFIFISIGLNAQGISYFREVQEDTVYIGLRNNYYAPYNFKLELKEEYRYLGIRYKDYFVIGANDSTRNVLSLPVKKLNEISSLDLNKIFRLQNTMGDPANSDHDDDYLYALPYKKGKTYKVTQGFNGKKSHRSVRSKYAIDFNLRIGDTVCAAREGIVALVQKDFTEHGGREYINKANRIIILHSDGTTASYVHLDYQGVLVKPGERVKKGQPIGISGLTGFTGGPHLHFVVREAGDISVPVYFEAYENKILKSVKAIRVLVNCAVALSILLVFSCSSDVSDPLAYALSSDEEKIKRVMDSLEQYEVQIIFSEIVQEEDGVSFVDYEFQLDDNNYFYPASTVKFPVAMLAMEKMFQDKEFDSETPFFVEGDTVKSDFMRQITRIFAVSENKAFNKLYEYMGRDYVNKKMQEKGLSPFRLAHRLSVPDADDSVTRPLIFQLNDSTLVSTEAIQDSMVLPLTIARLKKGKGYYEDGKLVEEPFDFSLKNYAPLSTLHNTMKRVIFPQVFEKHERFSLDNEDRRALLRRMEVLPRETINYSKSDDYYDSYVKFFMYGDSRERIPDYINIYNKVGQAYGYVTDCAYIEDHQNDVKFLLTATIHVNKDGIFNDDKYEYEEVGIPFLAELGRQIHRALVIKKFQ